MLSFLDAHKNSITLYYKNVLMSVIDTRSYEITKFSDICDLIYSFNQSHPKLTHIVIHSPSHNSYHSHSQSHSPNHSINDAIILRCIKTHNHSILHKNVLMSVIQTKPYEITKFSDICNFIYPLNQSHTHAYSYSYSLTHHHTIHTNRTISHIHPITWSTMLSLVDAHKNTITLYFTLQFIQSISHTPMLTHILIHSLTLIKITNQQPLTSPINNAFMQTLHHQLMLPLILWHLPAHPSLQPHSLSPTLSPTHSYTPHQHAHSLTFNWPLCHSINISIYQSIDWSMF